MKYVVVSLIFFNSWLPVPAFCEPTQVNTPRSGVLGALQNEKHEATKPNVVDQSTQGQIPVPSIPDVPVNETIQSTEITRSLLDEQGRDKVLLETSVRGVPFLRSGKVIGVRLFQLKPASVWVALGLQQGDVIESFNEHSIGDPSRLFTDVFQALNSAETTVLAFRRGDGRIRMKVNKK
jgi:type II secretory pathway component PulC